MRRQALILFFATAVCSAQTEMDIDTTGLDQESLNKIAQIIENNEKIDKVSKEISVAKSTKEKYQKEIEQERHKQSVLLQEIKDFTDSLKQYYTEQAQPTSIAEGIIGIKEDEYCADELYIKWSWEQQPLNYDSSK